MKPFHQRGNLAARVGSWVMLAVLVCGSIAELHGSTPPTPSSTPVSTIASTPKQTGAGSSAHAPLRTRQMMQPKPDVILVTLDTLRADHVGCYGDIHARTPALDALAQDGMRFSQAFTPSPITNTSHASILTGLLPSSHGVTDFGIPLTGHATLAELLHAHGYKTAAFIGAVILDSKTISPGFDRGFDYYDNFPTDPAASSAGATAAAKPRWGRVERRGMDVVARAEKWLAAHPGGSHFVWVHLYDAHDPYEPPEPFASEFKDRLYDGEIAYADSALANLLEFLKQHGSYDRSLIVAVGDHGEGLGEHHEETHGIFLYDSTTHVPLIVKMPGSADSSPSRFAAHNNVVAAQVRTIDIVPTVLDVLSIVATANFNTRFDGESFKAALSSPDPDLHGIASRVALAETDYPLRFGWAPLRSVRADGKKLIDAPRPELYDLESDPAETHDLYLLDQNTEAAQALRHKLMARPIEPDSHAGLLSGSRPEARPDAKDHIEEQNLLHRAMLATDDGRLADAHEALENVLARDAKSPTALLQLGQMELAAGNFAKAADYLHRARIVRPDDAAAARDEGRARAKLGDYAGAREALEASLALHPGQLDARLLLGEVYLKLDDPQAALDQFEAAGLLDSSSAAAKDGASRAKAAAANGGKK